MNIVRFIKKYSIGKILCYIIVGNFFTSYISINGNNITGMFIVIFSIVLIISSVILFSETMATRVFKIFLPIFTTFGSWRFSYLYR